MKNSIDKQYLREKYFHGWVYFGFSSHFKVTSTYLIDNLWLCIILHNTWHRFFIQFGIYYSGIHCAIGRSNCETKKIWRNFNDILFGRLDDWVRFFEWKIFYFIPFKGVTFKFVFRITAKYWIQHL